MEAYKAVKNDCDVPVSSGTLGNWVQRQRAALKGQTLSKERKDKLTTLGFKWILGKKSGDDKKWEKQFVSESILLYAS